MVMFPLDDRLHRAVKLALDSGEAASLEEATALFCSYRLVVEIGPDVARSASLQSVLLTAVNTGRRCFLGGVTVAADAAVLNAPLRVTWPGSRTIGEAIVHLHGTPANVSASETPRIVVGDVRSDVGRGPFGVRATMNGWSAGVTPLTSGVRLEERQECTPAGVLAGALAVSEAFQHVRGDTVDAGDRAVGLSLWRLSPEVDWRTADPGPALVDLPSRLWLIGLGHLGQAYLWTLGLLPYANAHDVELVLHDFDSLTEANDSTSPLTFPALVGQKKTRAMAAWADRRGFRTTLVERRFAPDFRVSDDEPRVALCGVDNPLARAALEDVGFKRIVEAGLGKGAREYLAMQLHTFPSSARGARARWGGADVEPTTAALLAKPAYRALGANGIDDCGLTTLAGRSVGAPFVGATTAALAVAEILRLGLGEPTHAIVDMTLRAPERRRAIINDVGLVPFNPGLTLAASALPQGV
jgi:hypothetical protein